MGTAYGQQNLLDHRRQALYDGLIYHLFFWGRPNIPTVLFANNFFIRPFPLIQPLFFYLSLDHQGIQKRENP